MIQFCFRICNQIKVSRFVFWDMGGYVFCWVFEQEGLFLDYSRVGFELSYSVIFGLVVRIKLISLFLGIQMGVFFFGFLDSQDYFGLWFREVGVKLQDILVIIVRIKFSCFVI